MDIHGAESGREGRGRRRGAFDGEAVESKPFHEQLGDRFFIEERVVDSPEKVAGIVEEVEDMEAPERVGAGGELVVEFLVLEFAPALARFLGGEIFPIQFVPRGKDGFVFVDALGGRGVAAAKDGVAEEQEVPSRFPRIDLQGATEADGEGGIFLKRPTEDLLLWSGKRKFFRHGKRGEGMVRGGLVRAGG